MKKILYIDVGTHFGQEYDHLTSTFGSSLLSEGIVPIVLENLP